MSRKTIVRWGRVGLAGSYMVSLGHKMVQIDFLSLLMLAAAELNEPFQSREPQRPAAKA